MRLAWMMLKPVLMVFGTLFGAYIAIDNWVVKKVSTQTEPLRREVVAFTSYSRQSLDRIELESRMMRSQIQETHSLILKMHRDGR